MVKIICPNSQYTGVSASVKFENGVGITDNKRLIAWFKSRGYTVEEIPEEDKPPELLEDMTVKQLQAFAAEKDIDVSGLKKKPELLEKITAVLSEREKDNTNNGSEKGEETET